MKSKSRSFLVVGLSIFSIAAAITIPLCISNSISNKSTNSGQNNSDNGENYNISESSVEIFKNNLKNINLDNFRDYFDQANVFPINEKSKMLPEVASMLSNNSIPSNAINNVSFSENSNTEDGYLNVNVTINLNSPYLFNGTSKITLTNVPTGIYNPNSEFNLSLFIINETSLNGFTQKGIEYTGNLYVPGVVNYVFLGNNYFDNPNQVPKSKCLSFEFANFYNFSTDYQQFINSPFEEVSFRGNTSFNTFNNFGMFQSSSNLKLVDFTDCNKLEGIMDQTFSQCSSLETLIFTNCSQLSYIGANAFYQCTSLKEIDLSSCSLTNVDPSAFSECTNLKTIYVKDDNAKQQVLSSIQHSSLSTNVIVK